MAGPRWSGCLERLRTPSVDIELVALGIGHRYRVVVEAVLVQHAARSSSGMNLIDSGHNVMAERPDELVTVLIR